MSGFSEDDLVAAVRRLLRADEPGVRVGVGDDAAVVEQAGALGVLTTDLLVEGVHFDPAWTSPRDLGYKALTVNMSDVAAMGGSPRYALVALGLPETVDLAWVVELYGGLLEAGAEHGLSVVGGDTSRSDRVVVSVAVTGEVAEGAAVTRSGARPGDRIVVTGALGAAAGGLILARMPASELPRALGTEGGRGLLAALTRPVARVGEGQLLARAGATAMMDLSDGLARDLGRLCDASGVCGAIRPDAVPASPHLEAVRGLEGGDPLGLALHGGDDYELLATVPAEAVDAAARGLWDRFGTRLTDIGEIRPGRGLVAVEPDGAERPLEPKGWDHFGG